jgi:hypothetical protein
MASSSKKPKTYHFHVEWETDYFFTQVKDKCVCLLCNVSVSVGKKGNVERHFKTVHSGIEKEYPLNSALRREKVMQLKSQLNAQQSTFFKTLDKNKAATEASFRVSKVIAQNRKPYEDGEFIKTAFLEAADTLFDNFKNKAEIMSAIKSVQLSANTVMRRVEAMSSDVISQLKTDFDRCSYFSLQLDESTDIVDTAQLAIFVRMVFEDFGTKEELVKVVPLTGRTTGNDIFLAFKKLIESENIPVNKLVALATDGAPAMVGMEKGFIALCHKDSDLPTFLSYHCIIHQQSLCGKFLSMNNVMKTVIKIVNKIRAHSLQRRLFRELTEELECQYGDLLLHTEVRWLSKGRVLQRFKELLPALVKFFKERGEHLTELEDPTWLQDFSFLTDLTEKLNGLNLQLQGKDKNIGGMISDVTSFSKKLELWENNLTQFEYKHFPSLKQTVEKQNPPQHPRNNHDYVEILSDLRKQFDERFHDFKNIKIVAQFINAPFVEIDAEDFAACVVKHFGGDQAAVEMEVVDFQNDLSLRSLSTTENIWPLVPKEKYPIVIQVALRLKAMFGSTYLCEATFSGMKFIKNKYRNRLTDEHLDNCIRMAATTYSPNFKKILDGQKEFHSSH